MENWRTECKLSNDGESFMAKLPKEVQSSLVEDVIGSMVRDSGVKISKVPDRWQQQYLVSL